MTDFKPGSQWLLPVRFKAFMGPPKLGPRHGWITLINGRVLQASGAIIDALIPADRITELEAEVARLREALEGAKDFIERNPTLTGMCCCGDYVKDHNGYEGHEAVDSGFYDALLRVEKIDAALNPEEQTKCP